MIKQDNLIPVDMLVVKASDPKGNFYVETKNLDGETNLKTKATNKELQKIFADDETYSKFDGTIECEGPNNAIYKFEGKITMNLAK